MFLISNLVDYKINWILDVVKFTLSYK